ncbi:hypothetical protein ES703_46943 [subsurface metagenome]
MKLRKLAVGILIGALVLALGSCSMAVYHITNVTELQEMNNDLAGDYILDNDIDAVETKTWNGGLGFDPIGTWGGIAFTGSFDGQGHKITGLFINRPATNWVALFGYTDGAPFLKNVIFENCNITGQRYAAALAGWNDDDTDVIDCSVSGNVHVEKDIGGGLIGKQDGGKVTNCHSTAGVTGWVALGGLIGILMDGVELSSCSATGDVLAFAFGGAGGAKVGGLIGEFGDSIVSDSYATGNVTAIEGPAPWWIGGFSGLAHNSIVTNCHAEGDVVTIADRAGGLLGNVRIDSQITECSARGNVSGEDYIGGLTGENNKSEIIDCFAFGNVVAIQDFVGGLTGLNYDSIVLRCCAAGNTTGRNYVGGLIGYHAEATREAQVSESHSLGSVQGNDYVGGLIGYNGADTSDCFSKSSTNGADLVGGFVGLNTAGDLISNSYSTGAVTGTGANVGGLIGQNIGTVSNSFWDTETSGQAASAGGTGLTTEEMKTKSTFTDAGWDFDTIWKIWELPVYEPSYPWLQADGRCQCWDSQPHPKQVLEPDNLLCEQRKNPTDVRDPFPEFSARHQGFKD